MFSLMQSNKNVYLFVYLLFISPYDSKFNMYLGNLQVSS